MKFEWKSFPLFRVQYYSKLLKMYDKNSTEEYYVGSNFKLLSLWNIFVIIQLFPQFLYEFMILETFNFYILGLNDTIFFLHTFWAKNT